MAGVLTLNTGSSSIKFGLYRADSEPEMRVLGQVDGVGAEDSRLVVEADGQKTETRIDATTHAEALRQVIDALASQIHSMPIVGVGHRIVHGGLDFVAPVELTADVQSALAGFAPLAPLHQMHNLAGVRAAEAAFPDAVQVGCFDTAFHRGHPWVNDTFAIPRNFYDDGVRRYGFHGLSYDYITGVIARDYPDLHEGRIVIAHLGNGASMCAVQCGKSVGSTMGFSALDGLPMGTRCGQIDPGAVLYLIEQKGMQPRDVMHMLYSESGLLGLSGESSDMRSLLASKSPEAAQAIEYYVTRARREVGALAAIMSGLDGLVFCGGIGENAPEVRARVLSGLGFLGIALDAKANASNAKDISQGSTRVLVIPTDEERVLARATQTFLP